MREKAVCPPQLRSGLFTVAAVDNIDHNPSSTSAHDSFHGTGISLFEHRSNDLTGVQRVMNIQTDNTQARKKTLAHLPEKYTSVIPVAQCRADAPIPKLEGPNKVDCQLIPQALQEEYWYSFTATVY